MQFRAPLHRAREPATRSTMSTTTGEEQGDREREWEGVRGKRGMGAEHKTTLFLREVDESGEKSKQRSRATRTQRRNREVEHARRRLT